MAQKKKHLCKYGRNKTLAHPNVLLLKIKINKEILNLAQKNFIRKNLQINIVTCRILMMHKKERKILGIRHWKGSCFP